MDVGVYPLFLMPDRSMGYKINGDTSADLK
jgi:hypothetical protein